MYASDPLQSNKVYFESVPLVWEIGSPTLALSHVTDSDCMGTVKCDSCEELREDQL